MFAPSEEFAFLSHAHCVLLYCYSSFPFPPLLYTSNPIYVFSCFLFSLFAYSVPLYLKKTATPATWIITAGTVFECLK